MDETIKQPILSPDEIKRYKRHLLVKEIGGQGQQRLKAARVLIVGAGGLGSPLLMYLAAAGVGTIGIIDDDRVSIDNLQRQIAYKTSDVGALKAECAAGPLPEPQPSCLRRGHAVPSDSGKRAVHYFEL